LKSIDLERGAGWGAAGEKNHPFLIKILSENIHLERRAGLRAAGDRKIIDFY